MKPFTADHPRLRSPEGVMSADEIRHWMRELLHNPVHGWNHAGPLADFLGFQDKCPRMSLAAKIRERNRAWIYPGEQIRFSRQLKRIIAGEVVCRQVPGASKGRKRWTAVLADTPTPLKLPQRFAYDIASGRLRWVLPPLAPKPMLPSFKTLLTDARKWQ